MAKILQFYVTNQKICKPPCTYLKPHDYLIPKSKKYDGKFNKFNPMLQI